MGAANVNMRAPWTWRERFRAETKSSLGKAWLQIALRCHGQGCCGAGGSLGSNVPSSDVMLAALEALGHPEGNYKLFRAGGRAMGGQG